MSNKPFIVTDSAEAYAALIQAGFIPFTAQDATSTNTLYTVFNSNDTAIPDDYKGRCTYTDRISLGKAVRLSNVEES